MAETIPREYNGLSSEVESVSKQSKQTEETKNTITTSENKTCKSASFSKSPETKRHLINLDVSNDNILPQHVRRGGVSRAAGSPLSKKSRSKSPSTSNIKNTPEKHMNRLPLPPRPKPPSNLNISGIAGDEIMEVVELEDDDYEITEETRPVPQFVISDCKPKPWIPCKSIIKKTFSTYTLTKLTHLYKCMSHSCSYSTQIKTNFIEHIKSHALWNNEHDKNAFKDYYECAYCLLNFESSGGLALHIDDYHSHCQYQCSYCFYRAESRVYIMKHMDNFHKTRPAKILVIPVSDDVKAKNIALFESKDYTMKTMIPYKCSVPRCLCITPLMKEFRSHLRKHRIEKVKCNECEEILSKPKDLIVHAQKHNKYFYHCIYCPYGDEIRDNLAGHLMVTHPEYPARVALRTPETVTNNQVKFVSLELSGTPRHMELLDTDLDHTGVEEKIEYEGPPPKNDTDTTPLISFDNRIN